MSGHQAVGSGALRPGTSRRGREAPQPKCRPSHRREATGRRAPPRPAATADKHSTAGAPADPAGRRALPERMSRRQLLAAPAAAGLSSFLIGLGAARAAEPQGDGSSSSSSGSLSDLLGGSDSDSSSSDDEDADKSKETPAERKKRVAAEIQKEYDREQLGDELNWRNEDFVNNAWQSLE